MPFASGRRQRSNSSNTPRKAGFVVRKTPAISVQPDSESAKTSFPYYLFKSAKVFNDPNARAASGYGLNTDYLKLKVHKDRNLAHYDPVRPANQTATVITIDMMANLVCGNASLQVVMHA